MNKLSSKLRSFMAGIFALACFSLPTVAIANTQCIDDYTRVIVTVEGYSPCPRGTSPYMGNPFKRDWSKPLVEGMNRAGQDAIRYLDNARRIEREAKVSKLIKDIRRIAEMRSNGTLSKSQARLRMNQLLGVERTNQLEQISSLRESGALTPTQAQDALIRLLSK